MRVPIAPDGWKEILLYGGGAIALGLVALPFAPFAAPVCFALGLFTIAFFRDPERRPEDPSPLAALSPADGRVTDIDVVEEPHFLGGRALRIGIFLSVLDVHVNRAPLDGTVRRVRYTPGAFLDARDPECAARNESNLVGFESPRGPFAVRQVAGLIARRIVCPLVEGRGVARGERIGMIKFGSRTELLVPADAPVDVAVEVGRRVRGGRTIVLRYRS